MPVLAAAAKHKNLCQAPVAMNLQRAFFWTAGGAKLWGRAALWDDCNSESSVQDYARIEFSNLFS